MKSNFIAELNIKRKAKALKKAIVNEGAKKNYTSVHSLMTRSENNHLPMNESVFSVLCSPAVVRTLNEANNYFFRNNEKDKAYDCFIYSLRIRNRQKENIDKEIARNITQWQPDKIQLLAKKGYEAYKHTRYLAIQALICRIQPIDKSANLSERSIQIINNYLLTGKLKGFYLFYLSEKVYHSDECRDAIFTMLRKGLKDPLLRKLIIEFLFRHQYQHKEVSSHYVSLYLSTLVESLDYIDKKLSVTELFSTIPLLPEGDEKTLLMALKASESGTDLADIEKLFKKIKKASCRYYFIRLVSGVGKEELAQHFAKNACLWKTPTFVAKLFKYLFDGKCYNLIITLFAQLSDEHREHYKIFTFYIGALRNADQVKLAKDLLKAAPEQMPEMAVLSQEYYLYKKEKDFNGALHRARKVYELQPEKNKQRWACAIVELMGAEGDFEAARDYVARHPQHAPALLPLIHFQEGTLGTIEHELSARIAAGEKNDGLHYYLSYLYCERKAYQKAIEQIAEAIDIKVNRRNALHYILLKSVVEKDYHACLSLIRNNRLDTDVLFAKYYAHALAQTGQSVEANEYLSRRLEVFNATEKDACERKLLLANAAKLAGDHKKSFELFASIFPEEHRCFVTKDKVSHSFSVMNLKSTAPIIRDDSQPLVSVIMTNFGWSQYTSAAIQSILDQTHSHFELIIIDDCSEKNAYRKLAKFVRRKKDRRIKLIRLKQNSGTYRAKNYGLSITIGEYITFQDSDDWSHPQRIQLQLARLDNKPECVATLCSYTRVNRVSQINFQNNALCRKGFISLFIKRKVLESIGFFDSVRTSADSEYYSRIETFFSPEVIDYYESPLYIASYHERSLTSYGLFSIDPIIGLSSFRKKYRKAYLEWHKSCQSGSDLFLPKKQINRSFNAPYEMNV
ncbi:glycosyltransferase [Candidatus Sororendozoicomonas aggregata]|uniref:glycosyltransferase n=1 Tax=Candidatus Sororendozoicomonas aggregata TaxID=3073239 RepID=UPI002ED00821